MHTVSKKKTTATFQQSQEMTNIQKVSAQFTAFVFKVLSYFEMELVKLQLKLADVNLL